MAVVTFDDIIYKGRALLDCRIKKDMTGKEVLFQVACVIEDIEKEINLGQVFIDKLGIDKCKLKGQTLLTAILNALIAQDISISHSISDIQTWINNQTTTTDTDTDEKVKVTSDAAEQAGYLKDKITTPQTSSIAYTNGVVSFYGFVPVGAVFFIDKKRVSDFDVNGKGKANTDVYGYAFSDGRNGTRNRFDMFIRTVDDVNNAGNTGGNNSFVIAKENLSSFELPVTGTISEALVADIQATFKLDANKITDGAGGSVWLLRSGPGQSGSETIKTLPFNIKHSHSFSLKAQYTNATPTPISLIPKHILEIPIERIPV